MPRKYPPGDRSVEVAFMFDAPPAPPKPQAWCYIHHAAHSYRDCDGRSQESSRPGPQAQGEAQAHARVRPHELSVHTPGGRAWKYARFKR